MNKESNQKGISMGKQKHKKYNVSDYLFKL
jgi:hypothetical protein